jgi:hypothetical protein
MPLNCELLSRSHDSPSSPQILSMNPDHHGTVEKNDRRSQIGRLSIAEARAGQEMGICERDIET